MKSIFFLITISMLNGCSFVTKREVNHYLVKSGDSLFSIGQKFNKNHQDLAKWNGISNPSNIFIGQKLTLHKVSFTKKIEKKKVKKEVVISKWDWPMKGQVTDYFKKSKGIKIKAKRIVRAPKAGKVVYTGNHLKGYGNLVILKHSNNFLTAYGNNSKLKVKEGQFVKKGAAISYVSDSLHFEIRKHGIPVNPMLYLKKL